MMEKIQRFGSAMLAPVLLFAFAGLAVGIGTVATLPNIVGDLANEDTFWYQAWTVWLDGAWTVFRQIELLFVLGLPIALAKTANARAVLEAGMVYLTFNYLVAGMLKFWGQGGSGFFQLDYTTSISLDNSDSYGTGLKIIAGIKTIDTGIFGAIIISAIVVWVHNRYFDKKLPTSLVFPGHPVRLRDLLLPDDAHRLHLRVAVALRSAWYRKHAGLLHRLRRVRRVDLHLLGAHPDSNRPAPLHLLAVHVR